MNCPFCGNQHLGHYIEERMMFTHCLSCGARGPLVPVETCRIQGRRHHPDRTSEILACDEAWQRRVNPRYAIPPRPDVAEWIVNRQLRKERP